ncbi:unnamed protein product [Schistosoma bovis]|uniref:RRP15-like protein n=1 Tax=Schistosoma haematobium TaxID=6185 RepID=A0A922LPI5_SCHHA|nr:hypothetical protein MS3_00010364 [Schistosoma haematobium]CAH8628208.1 unnamed protein product [Schistosoma intercalatum]CAH8647523.1 unnamed protein product [Schistosoma curassoni]CAH8648140.1 unnamed protein product [Schistosoma bovis]KAH9590831.1 hypothetical protein MS3_00010364 [Schistosoma haematobium]CAH8653929.1 unnamed protein product [Schistosoma bovis]
MGFKVIREILLQLLEENIPKDSHPILCLAKTDQERAKAKRRREGIDDEDEGSLISIARKKRRIWLKQAYVSPIAFAGIQRNTGDKAARDVSSREYLSEFEREKRLRCQATRGTVALFNAVKQHQTNIGKQLQGSKSGFEEERILTQVTTSDFLDRLSAGISAPKLSKTH